MKTIGENRVRTDFNVYNNTRVAEINRLTAELINLVDGFSDNDKDGKFNPELKRLKALGMTEYESAGHWAVKAATFNL